MERVKTKKFILFDTTKLFSREGKIAIILNSIYLTISNYLNESLIFDSNNIRL